MTTPQVVSVTDELIAELERSVECVWPETDHAVVTLRALLAERAELKRDAERYRWLRNPKQDVSLVIDKRTGYIEADDSVPGVGAYSTYEYRAGEDLDAAIDAAMQS